MMQLRVDVPEEFVVEEFLTTEGEQTILLLGELLRRYGFENFQVVRTNDSNGS